MIQINYLEVYGIMPYCTPFRLDIGGKPLLLAGKMASGKSILLACIESFFNFHDAETALLPSAICAEQAYISGEVEINGERLFISKDLKTARNKVLQSKISYTPQPTAAQVLALEKLQVFSIRADRCFDLKSQEIRDSELSLEQALIEFLQPYTYEFESAFKQISEGFSYSSFWKFDAQLDWKKALKIEASFLGLPGNNPENNGFVELSAGQKKLVLAELYLRRAEQNPNSVILIDDVETFWDKNQLLSFLNPQKLNSLCVFFSTRSAFVVQSALSWATILTPEPQTDALKTSNISINDYLTKFLY